MNTLSATGRLGGNPETRYTQNGKAVTSFSMAIESGWGDNKKTTWLNCTLWGRDGNPNPVVAYLEKGTLIGVTGEIHLRDWKNDQTGQQGKSLDLNVKTLTLLGGTKAADSNQDQGYPEASQPMSQPDPSDDNIPF